MTRRHLTTITVAVPALLIGLTALAESLQQQQRSPQQSQRPMQVDKPSVQSPMRQKSDLNFATFEQAKGMDVRGASEENLGDISDLILERGSGRIAFAVLDYGGTLGIGEHSVVIPYHAFNIDRVGDDTRLRLNMSASELKNAPKFKADEWETTDQDNWINDIRKFWTETVAWWNDDDPRSWRDACTNGKSETLRGEIIDVRRMDGHRPENVAVVLRTNASDTPRVVYLGPSWYVMTYKDMPQRGETIMVTAVPLTQTRRDGSYVARSIEFPNGDTLELRDQNGACKWNSMTTSAEEFWQPRYVLASRLLNDKVTDSTGKPAGHIDTLYFECTRGQTAFLGIDPDEKIADIGEVNRIVPFELLTWTAPHDVLIATTLAKLRTSTPAPDEARRLDDAKFRSQIYSEFNTTERRFAMVGGDRMRDRMRDMQHRGMQNKPGWESGGDDDEDDSN